MDFRKYLSDFIDSKSADFTHISDEIWGFAEPRFQEYKSSAIQQEYMKKEGFSVKADLAGEETAFIAEYGSGAPIIAFLGEFDSLSGLSQEADVDKHTPVTPGGEGHGCGHQLLGAAALAATVALKKLMEEKNLTGTIRYYGCPAEENAGGKGYLVRDGFFDDCDLALTWHPGTVNKVTGSGSLANFRVFFDFHGTSSHAAGAPHLGRSALDAVELMNVGVNYMREHMISDARVHYAVINTGGTAPNVVQSYAQVLYAIRAPKVILVKELYERVCDIAKGAALMTQTKVEIRQVAAYSDYIGNNAIAEKLDINLDYFLPQDYTKEELEYAKKFRNVITDLDKANIKPFAENLVGKQNAKNIVDEPIYNFRAAYNPVARSGGSTDVGDVSWVVPTGQFSAATWAVGTAGHSWQAVAQGKSSVAHKGMLLAAKVLACTGYEYLTDISLIKEAKDTWLEMLDGETYPNPLPPDLKPGQW
ncbi:MAG: M20 family metallopeptidase [Defluviitaleaceae bacterium]|nr:M20 family metallopeptidase [Defluviitaleaceae bacterium]